MRINPVVDKLIDDFYLNTIGSYWDEERKLIDNHYSTIPFPFREIPSPVFSFSVEWTLPELQGYLSTWSAVQKFMKARGADPVPDLMQQIKLHFEEKQIVRFPLFVKAGKVR